MEPNHIFITGDLALDTNIYKGIKKSPEVKEKEYGTLITETKGGSHLLFEIITHTLLQRMSVIEELIKKAEAEKEKSKNDKKLFEKLDEVFQKLNKIKDEILKFESENPIDCQYGLKEEIFAEDKFPESLKTFAVWGLKETVVPKPFQKTCGEKTNGWKVTEMMGWGQKKKEEDKKNEKEKSDVKEESSFDYSKIKVDEIQNPDILVFDDGGNNFRNDENAWNDLLYKGKELRNIAQVILKTAYPLGHGNLFQSLTNDFRNTLTIVTSINEIRKEDVLISQGISWEQTALDLVSELKNNKSISQLLDCKRLIVNFQSEGALYIEMNDKNEKSDKSEILKCRLIFDPEHLEGDWTKSGKIEGDVFGLMSCFTAAVTYGIQEAFVKACIEEKSIEEKINLESLITSGLSAMRRYKVVGHGKDVSNPAFPFESICSEIIVPNSQFASAFVPIAAQNKTTEGNLSPYWTILEGNYKPTIGKKSEPLFDTAFRFALFGDNELVNTPFLKINFLTTYDRREIEALHNIKNLITDYLSEEKPEKPLSLAVFGMPGSGKSFAVKQLAKSLELPILEFNLSQFADGELEGAFHLVRDKVLEGKPPIVFWDEFDSQAYKWLQYLLAPMQDGKFQSGQIIHPIGKSIFIFAGGTSYTFESFGIQKPEKPDPSDILAVKDYEVTLNSFNDFTLKKGPDFKSRLSGYLDIQGPNQLEELDSVGKIKRDVKGNVIYNEDDIQYPVRRALFIRGLCGKKGNEELVIDHGLLHALIKTRKFTHGSRSLEKVLSYLKTKNSNKLQRSNLPTVSILNMLVDNDFISLLNVDKFFEFQAFKIAPKIHQNWLKIGDTQGWKLEYHKDYNYLPAQMKEDNIAAARRIQQVLDALKSKPNLKIVPKDEAEFYEKVEFEKIVADPKLMEKMAKEEHKGWVITKENTGWIFGKPRNDDKKIHNCIIGWDEEKTLEDGSKEVLSVKDKNKDKDAIQNFVKVLKAAGFEIVKEKS
jgi:hypothetical protein